MTSTRRRPPRATSRHVARNRSYWNGSSDSYQKLHGARLVETAPAWGVWAIPESQLGVLGPLEGRDVLELGCGAAQWTRALAEVGARAVGVDLSDRQLLHARRHPGPDAPLVQADAERLPFAGESFDVVFCDHGATSFAHPERTVPEAARVLRPGGVFAFCMSTPIRDACWNAETDRVDRELVNDYFELSEIDDRHSTCFQLPYGAWIRLFRRSSLSIEDLVELRASEGDATTYTDYVPVAWAARWPAEHIWKLRKV